MQKHIPLLFIVALLLQSTAAEIVFVEPKAGTVTQLSATKGGKTSLAITIENTGPEIVQGASLQTDLNGEFTPATYSLEPGKQKQVEFSAIVNKNAEGTISTGTQTIAVKIEVAEQQDWLDYLLQKTEEHEKAVSLLTQLGMTAAVIAAIAIFGAMALKG